MSTSVRSPLFFLATLLLAGVFIRLGLWQVNRLEDRRARNAVAASAQGLPPLDYDQPGWRGQAPGGSIDNRRIRVTGRYDHAAEVVLRGQTEQGVPGVRIVTPLRPLRGDTALLVQRGFVASPDARTVRLEDLREEGVQVVSGLLEPLSDSSGIGGRMEQDGQVSWRRVELAGLRERLPYPIAGFLLLQLPDSALPALPRRDAAPVLDDGPHLSYAIQWFSFALTALVVGVIVGLGKRGPRTSAP